LIHSNPRRFSTLESKEIVGVITDRDLLDVADTGAQVKTVMAHPPVTITPGETVRKAAALMTGHRIGSLPVMDDNKLVGLSPATTFCGYSQKDLRIRLPIANARSSHGGSASELPLRAAEPCQSCSE
jgi:signal-transduction protein with cAMP-binding, CBS, and nucleotidyltransferase domain